MGFWSSLWGCVKAVATAPVKIVKAVYEFLTDDIPDISSSRKTKSVDNSVKISEELNKLKNDMAKNAKTVEDELIDCIMGEISSVIDGCVSRKDNDFNHDFDEIGKQSKQITDSVRGYIKEYYDKKLVQTNPDLVEILKIRDKTERDKKVKEFCKKLRKEAILNLKARIQKAIDKQIGLFKGKIQTAVQDRERSIESEENALNALLSEKQGKETESHQTQMKQIYAHGVCEILGTQLEEAQALLKA